jgi:hypothetical protein
MYPLLFWAEMATITFWQLIRIDAWVRQLEGEQQEDSDVRYDIYRYGKYIKKFIELIKRPDVAGMSELDTSLISLDFLRAVHKVKKPKFLGAKLPITPLGEFVKLCFSGTNATDMLANKITINMNQCSKLNLWIDRIAKKQTSQAAAEVLAAILNRCTAAMQEYLLTIDGAAKELQMTKSGNSYTGVGVEKFKEIVATADNRSISLPSFDFSEEKNLAESPADFEFFSILSGVEEDDDY